MPVCPPAGPTVNADEVWEQIDKKKSNMRLVIYDATRKPSLLDESWGAGAFSMWLRGRTEGMLGALSWKEVFKWLRQRSDEHGLINEVQLWMHGTPGEAYINGERLTDFIEGYKDIFKTFMVPKGLWWFRTCSTFQGKEGKEFARDFTELMGCKVAAHTFNIGCPTHSGLHSILPGQMPNWDNNEGVSKDGSSKRSYFWRPNTIPFWRNTIPLGW